MGDEEKTKAELIAELEALRQQRCAAEQALRRERDKVQQDLDQAGRFVGAPSSGEDLSERQQRAAALLRSEERLDAVFRSSPDYLMLLDRDYRIQEINRTEPGVSRDGALGRPVTDFVPPEARPRIERNLQRVVETGEPQQYESAFTRPDQTTTHFSSVAAPVVESGEVTGIVVSARDVTKRVELEREKLLLEEQFRQSQKMEAVGRLAGGIAHDFNNLLTLIRGYAGMIEVDLADGDPIHADIRQILDAGERATMLVRQLLAFSRKQQMDPQILDLNGIVAAVEPMLKQLVGEHIGLRLSLAEDLGRVSADPHHMEQVLMNLAVNARDAMPEGGALVIRSANVDPAEMDPNGAGDGTTGRHVMIAVSDTGEGMSDEVQDRIFEPFFTTKDLGKGTGLGLSTAYGIIRQSGGEIFVTSAVGKGTTFEIRLPRVD